MVTQVYPYIGYGETGNHDRCTSVNSANQYHTEIVIANDPAVRIARLGRLGRRTYLDCITSTYLWQVLYIKSIKSKDRLITLLPGRRLRQTILENILEENSIFEFASKLFSIYFITLSFAFRVKRTRQVTGGTIRSLLLKSSSDNRTKHFCLQNAGFIH